MSHMNKRAYVVFGVLFSFLGMPFVSFAETISPVTTGIAGLGAGVAIGSYLTSLGGAGSASGAIDYANAECSPVIPKCPKDTVPNPDPKAPGTCIPGPNKFTYPCTQMIPSVGMAVGTCLLPLKCHFASAPSLNGGSSAAGGSSGLGSIGNSLLGALGQVLGQMLSGGNSSNSGDSSGNSSGSTSGCTNTVTVNDPALLSGNPCAVYVASTYHNCSISGQTYSSVSQTCECPVGQSASYATNSCVSSTQTCTVTGQTYSSLTGLCSCPSGQEVSSIGTSCVNSSNNTHTCTIADQTYSTTAGCTCPAGQVISSDQTSCVLATSTSTTPVATTSVATQCSSYQIYSSTSNTCTTCPSGQTPSADKTTCVSILNTSTKANTTGTYIVTASGNNTTNTIAQIGYGQGMTSGYIDQNGGSGTIVARTIDMQNNTETAGFFGDS